MLLSLSEKVGIFKYYLEMIEGEIWHLKMFSSKSSSYHSEKHFFESNLVSKSLIGNSLTISMYAHFCLTHINSLTRSLPHSLTLSHTHKHTQTHTNTHKHTQTHTQTKYCVAAHFWPISERKYIIFFQKQV